MKKFSIPLKILFSFSIIILIIFFSCSFSLNIPHCEEHDSKYIIKEIKKDRNKFPKKKNKTKYKFFYTFI